MSRLVQHAVPQSKNANDNWKALKQDNYWLVWRKESHRQYFFFSFQTPFWWWFINWSLQLCSSAPQLWRYLSAPVKHLCWDLVKAIWYLGGRHFIWGLWETRTYISGNLPSDDSEAEEDLLTLKARSESLSSGLLLWEVLEDVEGGLDCSVPVSQWQTHQWTWIYTVRLMQSGRKNSVLLVVNTMCPQQSSSFELEIQHYILHVLFFLLPFSYNTIRRSVYFSQAEILLRKTQSNMSELLGIYVGVVGVGQIGQSSKLNSRSDRNYSAAFLQSGNIQIMYRPWLDLVNG